VVELSVRPMALEAFPDIKFAPLTAATWRDLEKLFGPRGACGGCWCMTWRLSRADYDRHKGPGNKRTLRRIVASGEPTGILAYQGDEPIGWTAIAPREVYVGLARSRVLKPVDARQVWSVTCFYVHRKHRHRGLSRALLEEAVRYAVLRGAQIIEGYPQDVHKNLPDAFVWTGLIDTFRAVGFQEVARRSKSRPIMRLVTSGE